MNMSTLQHGRPADAAEREPVERACYDLLDSLGISYDRVDHDAAFTIEACESVDEVLGTVICKNLFLCNRQKTQFYLLLIEGEKVFKTKYLSAQLGCSRLSFASPEDMERLLGVTPGSATVLSLMNDKDQAVQLVIDRPVTAQPYLGCHPCKNTSSLRIATADILQRFLPAVHHVPVYVDLPVEEPV